MGSGRRTVMMEKDLGMIRFYFRMEKNSGRKDGFNSEKDSGRRRFELEDV